MATLRIRGIGDEHDLADLLRAPGARRPAAVRVHVACPSSHDIAQEADATRNERWEDESSGSLATA
ncbi:MAG: hypothetical protein U1F43_13425 [Myxococcota bacterium]